MRREKNNSFDEVHDFLLENNDSIDVPISTFPWWISGTIKLLQENWKISTIKKSKDKIVGLLWVTFWEPKENYKNKNIWYVYLMILADEFQNKRSTTISTLQEIADIFLSEWIENIRFKTFQKNLKLNQLYDKLWKRIWIEKNTQWVKCNVFQTNIHSMRSKFNLK